MQIMSIDDKLSHVFGTEPMKKVEGEIITVDGEIIPAKNDALEHDYDVTRSNLHILMKQGQEALAAALSVAKQSEHPRAFEVVGGLMKHLSDVNLQLLDIHKKKQALDTPTSEESGESTSVQNNAIFIGSTNDLSKMLSDLRKGK